MVILGASQARISARLDDGLLVSITTEGTDVFISYGRMVEGLFRCTASGLYNMVKHPELRAIRDDSDSGWNVAAVRNLLMATHPQEQVER